MVGARTLQDAGRFVDRHSLVWVRRLEVPLAGAWGAISTRQGLERWWPASTVALDLRRGGSFQHEWTGTVVDFRELEFIDVEDVPAGTGGMRLELKVEGEATVFSFLDTWGRQSVPRCAADLVDAVQPGGRGTPWAGAAADWHAMVDRLETVLTGARFEHARDELVRFYAGHLADHFRRLGVAASRPRSVPAQ